MLVPSVFDMQFLDRFSSSNIENVSSPFKEKSVLKPMNKNRKCFHAILWWLIFTSILLILFSLKDAHLKDVSFSRLESFEIP